MDQIIFAGPESDRELFDFIIQMSSQGAVLFELSANFQHGELCFEVAPSPVRQAHMLVKRQVVKTADEAHREFVQAMWVLFLSMPSKPGFSGW